MKKTCVVCENSYREEVCTVILLTPQEEATLIKHGANPPEEYVYCPGCWKLIRDPELGPRLLRNTAERQMLKLGVNPARARQVADRYHSRLLELQRQRHHKIQA